MIIAPELRNKYNFSKPYLDFIKATLDQTLMNYSNNNFFAYSSRIKTVDSLSEKIETGRFRNWNDLDDLVACVIIIPNLSYENQVLDFLKNSFETDAIRKKGSSFKNFEIFRFDSTRYIGRLKRIDKESSKEIFKLKFEIQIRSAFEHAWSVTTHDLAYKSSTIDWQLLRLAAQLKSSVEQLDMIALGADVVSKNITEHKWPEIDIKKDILQFLQEAFDKESIPNELRPKDFSRVIDNIYKLLSPSLSIFKQKEWRKELKAIFKCLEDDFKKFQTQGFPMSLSLYQIIFGILVKESYISKEVLDKTSFYRGSSFNLIFPELKNEEFLEFKLGT